jgi:hypothetical protein
VSDPVAWIVIEPGWDVVDRDGRRVGRVDELVGDADKDIFSGLKVHTRLLGKPRFVPAERVRAIYEGRVELDLSGDDADGLDEYDEPAPQERLRPS